MGLAMFLVINLVLGLGALSLLMGTFETLFGKPKLTILRSNKNGPFFAFGFKWNSAKEPALIDFVGLRLFNPFGSPKHVEVSKSFESKSSSFAEDVDMGPGFMELLGAENFELATIQVSVKSSKTGVSWQFDMKGSKFKKLVSQANFTTEQFLGTHHVGSSKESKPPIDIPIRSFIADTVPGKGAQIAIPTNPAFAAQFAGANVSSGGTASTSAPVTENFKVSKVWIEPGCIVCNACEDIYKDVFEVKADTCIIRPNAPLDDGLRIREAAEACPVEVIKFTIAS
jgi:ferredoxin